MANCGTPQQMLALHHLPAHSLVVVECRNFYPSKKLLIFVFSGFRENCSKMYWIPEKISILLKYFVHLLFWSFVFVILKAVSNHSKSKPQVYVLLLNFEHRSAGVAEWKREANYGSSSATSDRYLWRREDKKGGRSKLYGGGIFWSQAENWTLTVREVIMVSIRWHRFWHLDILTYWCVGEIWKHPCDASSFGKDQD